MINGCFEDWSENPVITSITTITSPIDELQFPTVTVCSEDQPSNWAFLENVLNFLAFECDSEEECDETQALRKDFKYLIKSFVNVFGDYLYHVDYNDTMGLIISKEQMLYKIKEYQETMHAVLIKTENKSLTKYELTSLISEYFLKDNYGFKQLGDLLNNPKSFSNGGDGFVGYSEGLMEYICITSKTECYENVAVLKLFYQLVVRSKAKFGTFLKNYVHLEKFTSLNSKMKTDEVFKKYEAYSNLDICKLLMIKEKELHNLFKRMAVGIGFNASEAVSLYDLPAMLSSSILETSFPLAISEVFLFSLCEDHQSRVNDPNDGGLTKQKFDKGESCIEKWYQYLRNLYSLDKGGIQTMTINPCEEGNIQCCNKWTNKLGNNLRSIMKVMRLAGKKGTSGFNLQSVYDKPNNTLEYKLRRHFGSEADVHTLLPWCDLKSSGKEKENQFVSNSCNLFQPVFTDSGLCHAFNPTPALELLKSSYFTKAFNDTFKHDFNPNLSLVKGIKNGYAVDFFLLGNTHQYNILDEEEDYFERKVSNFLVSVTNKDEYFNMKVSKERIKAGYHTIWKVMATEIIPSEDLQDVPISHRKCRLAHEAENLELFEMYTQSACQFEEKVKQAEKVCNCLPWYIPSKSKEKYNICDYTGNYCYKMVLDHHETNDTQCLPNCHQLEFDSFQFTERLDYETTCKDLYSIESLISMVVSGFQYNSDLLFKVRRILDIYDGDTDHDEDYETKTVLEQFCEDLVRNDLARVSVMFGRKKYVKGKIGKRATFSDQLGSFGKFRNVTCFQEYQSRTFSFAL